MPPVPKSTQYRYVGYHAQEFTKENGSLPQLAPGDFIDLTDAEYHSDINIVHRDNLIDVAKAQASANAEMAAAAAQATADEKASADTTQATEGGGT